MLRESTRVAVIAFVFVTCLWAGRETYAPGRQHDFPWLTGTGVALLAGAVAAYRHHHAAHRTAAATTALYRRRGQYRPRRADPGE